MADTQTAKKPPYRPLNIKERDMLFAFYEKWNGNMSEMVLDPQCPFRSYTQIRYYAKFYHFHEQFVEIRRKKAEEVTRSLQDAKVKAVENAVRLLEPRHRFVFSKTGVQIFDGEGNPLIVEQLPYYKEIKAAWEIIKTELGEPTSISKSEVSNPTDSDVSKALDVIADLAHAKPQADGSAVPSEPEPAGDTAEA